MGNACKGSETTLTDDKPVPKSEIHSMLTKHGIDNERLRNGLIVAFDADESGNIDRKEFRELSTHLAKLKKEKKPEKPHDLNAWIKLGSRTGENYESAGNSKLKMFFTSSGLTPGSTAGQKEAFTALKNRAPGNGVLYVIDARLMTLQFHLLNADPDKCNDQNRVAYYRSPDKAGGTPHYSKDGKVIMKTQEQLSKTGDEYADVHWDLRYNNSYGNVDVGILTENVDETPVYVCYLAYEGKWVDDKPEYKILVGKGVMRDGKFVALQTDGTEFTEEDYERHCDYEHHGDFFYKETSDDDFAKIVDSVQVIQTVGGIPVIPMLRWQPHFIHDGHDSKVDNPYGKAILDAIKSGNVAVIGMSAGSMVFSWCIGPLTSDPDELRVMGSDGEPHTVSLGPEQDLGKFWLFPGLGQYIGMPHDISLKCHKRFDPVKCAYGGNAKKAEAVGQVVGAMAKKSRYCALLQDYNWGKGHGDCLEIADGKIFHHVGFNDDKVEVNEEARARLEKLGSNDFTMPVQPPNNPPEGWKFEWLPESGEVISAGPDAKRPFHMYACSDGILDQHPAYCGKQ